MVLSGNLSEYPLEQLLEIFLHQKETGLLEVSSPLLLGNFYLKNGEIKDGHVGKLRGAEAINLAQSWVDGVFRFRRLESTDYAQIVWQKSFGSNNVDKPSPPAQIVRRLLTQLLSYPIAAYGVVAREVVALVELAMPRIRQTPIAVRRAVRRQPQLYKASSNRSSHNPRISRIARGLKVIRTMAARLPARQQVVQSISFGVAVVVMLSVITACIYTLMRTNQRPIDAFATTQESIDTESQTQPSRLSNQRRPSSKVVNNTRSRNSRRKHRQSLAAR